MAPGTNTNSGISDITADDFHLRKKNSIFSRLTTKHLVIMEVNMYSGEYLTPEVEVVGFNAQAMLCESDYTVTDPFTGTEEKPW